MKRRAFITLFSSAAAWPLAGGAQTPPKIPRVGYLGNFTPTTGGLEAFRHGLRDLGYVEGQTIALEVRWAEGRSERLPELAAELLRLKVDVLFVGTSTAALVAKKATGTIPIVIVAGHPIVLGLLASLARPGGNLTVLRYFTEGVTAKRLQLLKELVPGLTQVAVLRVPGVAIHAIFWREIE